MILIFVGTLKHNQKEMEKRLIQLEKMISQKIHLIKLGKITPAESGIGKLINSLKVLDEPLYDKLLSEYKEVLKMRK